MRYEAKKIKRQNGDECYTIEEYTIDPHWPLLHENDRTKWLIEQAFYAGVQHAREQARLAFADLIEGSFQVRKELTPPTDPLS